MFIAKSIETGHTDIINDISFDYHGTRMATCSSDQTVKVWDEGDDGKWVCTASWKTHSGSVWKVTWAHPEFGQVLATCSFDRKAAIWEELTSTSSRNGKGGTSKNTWLHKASLVDSRTFVTDIQFAPKYLGLQLATCSADGIVRIYEAVDLMSLSNWQLQHEIPITINNAHISLSSLSWCTSRLDPPTIAVGSDDNNHPNHPKVFIYRYNDNARKWDVVENLSKVTDPVNDVQFALHLGRSFHMLAVASRELSIFSLKELGDDPESNVKQPVKFEVRHVGSFDNHKSMVWRVSWSITGTRLASSGDDGCVMLWKANYLGQWKCFKVLSANGSMSEMECATAMSASLNSTAASQMGF